MRRKINGNWKITGNAEGILDQILIVEKTNQEYSYRPEIPIMLILPEMLLEAQISRSK